MTAVLQGKLDLYIKQNGNYSIRRAADELKTGISALHHAALRPKVRLTDRVTAGIATVTLMMPALQSSNAMMYTIHMLMVRDVSVRIVISTSDCAYE